VAAKAFHPILDLADVAPEHPVTPVAGRDRLRDVPEDGQRPDLDRQHDRLGADRDADLEGADDPPGQSRVLLHDQLVELALTAAVGNKLVYDVILSLTYSIPVQTMTPSPGDL
jgi:hypothetical protein